MINNTRRRSKRSAMAPPNAPTNKRGMLSKNATTPMAKGERVSSHTNQLWATFCMKSPELEISAPSRSRRKLRCRRVRRGLMVQRFCTSSCHHRSVSSQCSGKCPPIAKLGTQRRIANENPAQPPICFSSDIQFLGAVFIVTRAGGRAVSWK